MNNSNEMDQPTQNSSLRILGASGVVIIPILVLVGRWSEINFIVYAALIYYVFIFIPFFIKDYNKDKIKKGSNLLYNLIIPIAGTSVALLIMTLELALWALTGAALWFFLFFSMNDADDSDERIQYRRVMIWIFLSSFCCFFLIHLADPDALHHSFNIAQFFMAIFFLIGFYSFIQAVNPGESVGTYYLIECPHCKGANKIRRIADSTISNPIYKCDHCGNDFRWVA